MAFRKKILVVFAICVACGSLGYGIHRLLPWLGGYRLTLSLPRDYTVARPQAAQSTISGDRRIYEFNLFRKSEIGIVLKGQSYVWICEANSGAGEEYVTLDEKDLVKLRRSR